MKYIDMLYLSIDGYKENYERDRVNAKWNKLIKYLENIKNMNRHSCTLAVNYVINKYNIQDIPKIKSIIKEYNLDKLRLNIASNWSENSKISDNNKTWNYSKEQIKQLKKYKSEIMGKSPWTFSNCFWPHNGIYVRVDGLVTVCVMNTNTKPFGNIYEQSIEDIRNSERFIKIKNGCINDNPDDHCKNCSYKELSSLLEIIGVNNKSKFGRNEK
jgi:radical SAM protein with 4Fe4S-binding SPASM domain